MKLITFKILSEIIKGCNAMRIKDLMVDWLSDTELFEMAFARKDAINKVRNVQSQIARHIIKYFYYDVTEETKKHWVAEIDAWLAIVDDLKLKNGKRLSGDIFYKLLFDEPLGEITDIQGIVKNIDKIPGMRDYDKIGSLTDLHIKCEKVLHAISYDLANDKFEDFLYYANKV